MLGTIPCKRDSFRAFLALLNSERLSKVISSGVELKVRSVQELNILKHYLYLSIQALSRKKFPISIAFVNG